MGLEPTVFPGDARAEVKHFRPDSAEAFGEEWGGGSSCPRTGGSPGTLPWGVELHPETQDFPLQ